jgi:integrase
MNTKGQKRAEKGSESGPVMAQTTGRPAKTHQDYWKGRLVHRSYEDRDGNTVEMPEFHCRIADAGRREWFNLGTANQTAAAIKARDIYVSIISAGWEATIAKFKPSPVAKITVCTVGEFVEGVRKSAKFKPMTLRRYAVKLRKMIADIAKVDAGAKVKEQRKKNDYVNGGHKVWLGKVDSQSLGLLTPLTVKAWSADYVAKAGTDPVKIESATRSAASYLRCVRALFTNADVNEHLTKVLNLTLPLFPFEGVKIKAVRPERYESKIDPALLLACAQKDLHPKRGQEYLALNLCLWAGLRRKEADLLTWKQVNFEQGQIRIETTPYFTPKTKESTRTIDLSAEAIDIIKTFKAASNSEFVLDGGDARLDASYDYYRANPTWKALQGWLKEKGVTDQKAIHTLRKESGSLMANLFGIESARQHLGHQDIGTTSSFYVAKKERREVSIGSATLRAVEA